MRPHFPRPFAVHHPGAPLPDDELSLAESRLGASHRLVQALDRLSTAREQLVAITAVQAGGVVMICGGWRFGLPLVVAAGGVQVALCCRLAVLRSARRDRWRDLIIAGDAGLGLQSVGRLCVCLLDGRTREQLARSIEEVVRLALHPRRLSLDRWRMRG